MAGVERKGARTTVGLGRFASSEYSEPRARWTNSLRRTAWTGPYRPMGGAPWRTTRPATPHLRTLRRLSTGEPAPGERGSGAAPPGRGFGSLGDGSMMHLVKQSSARWSALPRNRALLLGQYVLRFPQQHASTYCVVFSTMYPWTLAATAAASSGGIFHRNT